MAECIASGQWTLVDGPRFLFGRPPFLPVSKQVYTVDELVPEHPTLWLGLAEIPTTNGMKSVFDSIKFKPVLDTSTDITGFTELLNPLHHKWGPELPPTPGDRVRPKPVPVSSR